MKNLQMTEEKTKKLDEIEDLALDTIKQALKEEIDSDDERVKVSVKTLGIVAKNRQTSTHRSAIEYGMAANIATPEQLKKYINATNPQIKKTFTKKLSN